LNNPVQSAYPLLDPSRKLPFRRENGVISVSLPARSLDDHDTVIVLEISGRPSVDPPLITQDSDSPFELDYAQAMTAGNAVKRFNRDGGFHISNWTGPSDLVAWRLLVSQTGSYKVSIRYAARKSWGGTRYVVTVGSQTLTAAVEPTGDWYEYKTFDLGTVKLPKAAEYLLSIRPADASTHNLMYFKSLNLEAVSLPGGRNPTRP
jgi:alpha-L-fucosidase